MKYLILVLLVGLFSCSTTITEKDKKIREASVMIGYYRGLISYEKEVDTMPYEYIVSLEDSLEMWYNIRHKLIVGE